MTGWDWAFWASGAAIGVAGLLLCAWALFRDRSRGRRRCPRCWYDMAHVPGMTCPECGRAARRETRFFRTRRRWRWAALGAAVLVLGAATAGVPGARSGDWILWVPPSVLSAGLSLFDNQAEAEYVGRNVQLPPPAGAGARAGAAARVLSIADATLWERMLLARYCAACIDGGDPVPAILADLGPLGPAARIASPALGRALARSGDTSLLRGLSTLDERVRTPVLRRVALRHSDPAMRVRAVALLPLREATLGIFSGALRDGNQTVRLAAIGALTVPAYGQLKPPQAGVYINLGPMPAAATTGPAAGPVTCTDAVRRSALVMLRTPLSDRSPEVRIKALRAMLVISADTSPDAGALRALWRREETGSVRAAIADGIARVCGVDEALPCFEAVLADPDEAARLEVLLVIRRLGPRTANCVRAVSAAAARGPARTTGEAVVTLGFLGAPAAPELAGFLRHADEEVRVLAARAIGLLGEDGCAAGPDLARALDDEAASVRYAGARSLRKCRESGAAARARLERMTREDEDEGAAQQAEQTLEALNRSGR